MQSLQRASGFETQGPTGRHSFISCGSRGGQLPPMTPPLDPPLYRWGGGGGGGKGGGGGDGGVSGGDGGGGTGR